MQDLKAGYLLGATPWKQQLMQCIGVVSAALIIAPVLNLLLTAYGMGPPSAAQPESLAAPQATLMAAVASGVLDGDLPWSLVGVGALIGTGIILVDEYLRRSGASVRAPVLAVAVGIYLPLELSVPIFLGGLLALFSGNRHSPGRSGLLFAAGLITGEALIGIFLALPIVLTGNPDVLAASTNWRLGAGAGLLALAATGALLFANAAQNVNAPD